MATTNAALHIAPQPAPIVAAPVPVPIPIPVPAAPVPAHNAGDEENRPPVPIILPPRPTYPRLVFAPTNGPRAQTARVPHAPKELELEDDYVFPFLGTVPVMEQPRIGANDLLLWSGKLEG